jgi:ketosteroid isomerase-like protein
MSHSLAVARRRLLAMTAAAAVLPLPPLLSAAARDDKASLAAVMVKFRRAYETLDEKAMEALLADDIQFSDPTFHHKATGLAEMRKIIAETTPHFLSFRIIVEHELIAPPWVVARQELVALRKSPSHPAGYSIRVRGVSLLRIVNGRIHEWHDYYDAMGYERQLREASKPAPGGAR